MSEVVHHVALALAALALGHAALRAVSPVAEAGLLRVVAAAATGVALAVAEALTLGLAGLGASPVALVLTAVLTWSAAMRLAPAPSVAPGGELVAWWGGLGRGARLLVAGSSGAAVAWLAWQLVFPSIGFDSSLYHYPLVAGWIHNGRPGSPLALSYDIPYSAYPQTDEIAQTWAVGIARSWVPFSLWNPALFLLLIAASIVTLRNLSVPRGPAAVAVAALVLTPIAIRQLGEPQTDLPALAWLTCTAALATGAARRPGLLVPALLAGGLAIGTKPSTGALVVAALLAGAIPARARLRFLLPWLALGTAGAGVVGGIWYLRNIGQHGSPFWPFVKGPFGDTQPRFFALVDKSFLSEPVATLRGRLGEYRHRLGGGGLLLVALPLAVLAAGLARRRRAQAATALAVTTGIALVALLAWSTAWGSGLVHSTSLVWADGFSLSALRFLLPAIGAAVLALAVATRLQGAAGKIAVAVLALAAGWSLILDVRLGAPWTPPITTLLLGALGGVALLGLGTLVAGRGAGRGWPLPAGATAALVAVLAGLAVAPASNGYLARYAKSRDTTAYGHEVVTWLLSRPEYTHGHGTIEIASRGVLAQFSGDHFEHPLSLIPQHATCAQVAELARGHDTFVTGYFFFHGLLGLVPYSAPRCVAHLRPVFRSGGLMMYRLPAR